MRRLAPAARPDSAVDLERSAAAVERIAGLLTLVVLLVPVGCQSWDRLQPDEEEATASVAGSEAGSGAATGSRLTGAEASRRIAEIEAASGAERLRLIEELTDEFPEARAIPALSRLAGEAHLAAGDAEGAAAAFERAVTLSGTDLLGLPLEAELALQAGWAHLQAGDAEAASGWLVGATFLGGGERLDEMLHWAHDELAPDRELEGWLAAERARRAVEAPGFTLPGLQQQELSLAALRGEATLINFWAPT